MPSAELLDDLALGVLLVREGRVQFVNQAAAHFLELDGYSWRDLPLIAVLRDHRLECAYLEGRTVECETRGRVLRASPVHGGLSLLDVSDARRSQEEARELLAVLSHELRTPVATIKATLEALRSDALPAELRERFLQRAEAESERLVRLLEDLTVEVRPPRYRSIFLPEAVARAAHLVQRTFAEHGVKLVQQLEPLTVWADADKLLQVLINLLENAAIHGPDNRSVTLLAEVASERPEVARILVRDQGPPLLEDGVESLFEPHARGRTVKAKGTGLGLYIVRSIAERWGGEAWGRPLPDGNEFGVTVRLRPSA